ncbi:Ig-like domain-containing protein [Gemmatimonadota bacterium]
MTRPRLRGKALQANVSGAELTTETLKTLRATMIASGRMISWVMSGALLAVAVSVCSGTTNGPSDVVPGNPGTVQDLAVVSFTATSVTLRWTQVDDGTQRPARYWLRFGSPSISWDQAAGTTVSLVGTGIGTTMEHLWEGFQPGTTYGFQLIAYRQDSGGERFGGLSNVVSATTAEPEITSVTATPSSLTFAALGETAPISVTARNASGSIVNDPSLAWQSLLPSVATVDESGLVTATGVGTTQIVVRASCCEASDTVSVSVSPAIHQVTATPSSLSFTALGDATQLEAEARDGSGAVVPGTSWVWQSLDPSVVDVSDSGLVTAQGAGTAGIVVTAACCGVADTVSVTVSQVAHQLVVAPFTVWLDRGQTKQLSATVLDRNGFPVAGASVDWVSANPTVASVEKTGDLTANVLGSLAGGSTEVMASYGDKTTSIPVAVAPDPWFEEVWDYTDTNDLWGSPNVEGFYLTRGTVSLQTGLDDTPWGGTKAVQLSFEGGAKVYQEVGVDLRPPRADDDRPREVWLEVYVRYDAGFQIHSDHKTIFYLETGHTNRWALHFGVFGTDVQGRINDSPWWDPVWPMPNLPTWLWDGEWHLLQWHLKMSTNGVGGAFEAWLDGENFLRSNNIDTASPTDAYFDPIALGRNGDPIAPSSMYWGRLRVYTVYPGW